MKPHLRTVKEKQRKYVDTNTGEVISEEIRSDKVLVDNQKDFVLMFSRVIGLYKGLSGAEIKILAWLIINQSPYNSNVVTLTGEIKKLIAEEMDISLSSVSNAVPRLIKKGVFIRKGGKRSATYLINPLYFWKGNLTERNKVLRYVLEIEYNPINPNTDFDKQ